MQISVEADFKQVTKGLNKLQRKQIPFATAGALNDTAFQAKALAVKAMPRFLDRPNPTTMKGLMVGKAKKTRLTATVFFKDFVWRYMKYQVLGGTRSTGRKIAVPSRTIRLNKYGNIPGRRGGLIKGGAYVAELGSGLTGIFKPKGKKTELRAILVNQATYKPRYPFHAIIERAVRKRFKKNFHRNMERAMRSAR